MAYKPVCRTREIKFMLLAEDVALPMVSRVGVVDDTSSQWEQKGVIMDLGYPLDVTKIAPAERLPIAQQMISLVSKLHEKGVIHGDIRPGNFVRRIDEDGLRMVGFSSARMADNSDLSMWLAAASTLEYTAPSRGLNSGPPSLFDDYYALSVSIWAIFVGENPTEGLFNSNEGPTPDMTKIIDDDMFGFVVDILVQGGLRLDSAHTASPRSAVGLSRSVSSPLSLFDAEPDELGQQDEAKAMPRFCPHCFEMVMADAGTRGETMPPPPQQQQQHLTEYPESCHLKTPSKHDMRSLSEYALEWLLDQEGAAAAYDYEEPWVPVLEEEGISAPLSPGRWPSLRVDTSRHRLKVEEPVWSGVSAATPTTGGATIVPADRTLGRDRSTTVTGGPRAAASESDEGYASMPRRRSCAFSWTDSETRAISLPGTLSDGSRSSSEHNSEGDGDGAEIRDDADPWLYTSSPPLTPMPPRMKLFHVGSSFDSVALSDDGVGAEKGAISLGEIAGSAPE